jgi:hypothetical protein
VDIKVQNVPFKIAAQCAVERPLKFRLVATSLQGPEVDIGSNPELKRAYLGM